MRSSGENVAHYRHLSPEEKEEAVAEAVGMCWANHLHCASSGKRTVRPSVAQRVRGEAA
jgi:hypothetical protein